MAYYGIPSAGLNVSAGSTNDSIEVGGLGGTLMTANNIYGGDGNDIISLGAVGRTAVASAHASSVGTTGVTAIISATVFGSASYTNVTTGVLTANNPLSVAKTGVITSDQAIRIVNGSYLQANAGNDTIALGDSLTRASASTIAAGAGNDWIGWATNVDNNFNTSTNANATVAKTDLQGGLGNDTVVLDGASTYTAFSANLNGGNDKVTFDSALFQGGSYIGLGAGNDIFSGDVVEGFATSTLAGGKGNDTIYLGNVSNMSANAAMVAGDRAENSNATDDGDDTFLIGGNGFISSTVYGGGGADTITFNATGGSGNFISMNAGNDVFTATEHATRLQSSTLGMGAGNDKVNIGESALVLSSTINLGKGNDSIYISANMGSGAQYTATTLYGGAGADYLLGSAAIETNTTNSMIIQYKTATESTVSAYDTIAIGGGSVSSTFKFNWTNGDATRASFSASELTATNGVVTFTATYATDLTSRVSALDTNTTNAGEVALFLDGSDNAYMFIKGSSDDLVVKVGSAAQSAGVSAATVSISQGKDITYKLGG